MVRIICLMKSKESHHRLLAQYNKKYIEWDSFVNTFEELQEKITTADYDYAIIDTRLYWFEEATSLFKRSEVPTIEFEGDFEDIFDQLDKIVHEPEEEEVSPTPISLPIETQVHERTTPQRIQTEKVYVEKAVYKPVYTGLHKKVIAVCNLSSRAGSTFLTLNLAAFLAKLEVACSVIELPLGKPYIFDAVELDKKLEGNSFTRIPELILSGEQTKREAETIIDGISWLVQNPMGLNKQKEEWDYFKMMKLLYASKFSSISILDCGSYINIEDIKETVLNETDLILIVVDPLPVECMHNEDLLRDLVTLKKNYPIEFVINKWARGIPEEDFNSFLQVQTIARIPYIDPIEMYKCIYSSTIPFNNKLLQESILKPMFDISKFILPESFLLEHLHDAYQLKSSSENVLGSLKKKLFRRK